MQTNKRNDEDYREKSNQSSQPGSNMSNENYKSQEMNREHSDNVRAGEHNYQQDETQYGKIRQSEEGMGKTEQRADNLRDKVNSGVQNAEEKVNDYSNRAENKMEDWSDKAQNKMNEMGDKVRDKMDDWSGKSNTERANDKYEAADKKMDKAEKKMDKAQDKFEKGYENDGMRKMEKAEKKMDKADDKIQDAHSKLGESNSGYNSGRDNAKDYENRNL